MFQTGSSSQNCAFWASRRPLAGLNAAIATFIGVVAFIVFGTATTQARMAHPPVVSLACASAPPELCRAMISAIGKVSGGRFDVRLVDTVTDSVDRPADLGMALTVDGRGEHWIAAHIDWKSGADGAWQQGPSVELGVMDANLTQRMYDRYAENLLRADTGIITVLSRDESTQ